MLSYVDGDINAAERSLFGCISRSVRRCRAELAAFRSGSRRWEQWYPQSPRPRPPTGVLRPAGAIAPDCSANRVEAGGSRAAGLAGLAVFGVLRLHPNDGVKLPGNTDRLGTTRSSDGPNASPRPNGNAHTALTGGPGIELSLGCQELCCASRHPPRSGSYQKHEHENGVVVSERLHSTVRRRLIVPESKNELKSLCFLSRTGL